MKFKSYLAWKKKVKRGNCWLSLNTSSSTSQLYICLIIILYLALTTANQQTDDLPTFDTAQTNNDVQSNPNLPSWEVEGRIPVSVVKDNEDPMNAEQSQYTRPTTEQVLMYL